MAVSESATKNRYRPARAAILQIQNIYCMELVLAKKVKKKKIFYRSGPCLTDGGRGRRLGQDWCCMGIAITEKGDDHDDHDSLVIVIITTDCDSDHDNDNEHDSY